MLSRLTARMAFAIAIGLLVVCAGLAGAPAHAEALGADGVYYTRQPTFLIPFQPDSADRRIQSVLLYVSEDLGKNYRNIAAAGPADRVRLMLRYKGNVKPTEAEAAYHQTQSFAEDSGGNLTGPRTQRHAHSDFAPALRNGIGQQAVKPERC